MKNRLQIETARLEDASELADLHTLVAEDLTRKLGAGLWSRPRTRRTMRDRIDYALDPRQKRELIVLREGPIVGTVLLSRRRVNFWRNSLWQAPRESAMAVFDLAIHPEFQRRGYGRYLMEFAEEESLAYQFKWIRLDAYADNPLSNAFYESLGYQNRGLIKVGDANLNLYEKSL